MGSRQYLYHQHHRRPPPPPVSLYEIYLGIVICSCCALRRDSLLLLLSTLVLVLMACRGVTKKPRVTKRAQIFLNKRHQRHASLLFVVSQGVALGGRESVPCTSRRPAPICHRMCCLDFFPRGARRRNNLMGDR